MYKCINDGFSILIPTFNNLPFLKLCIKSVQKNTVLPYEIIVHINEGSDGTLEWVQENGFKYTYNQTNVGLSSGLNQARKLAKKKLTVFLNDDMYMLPEWDTTFRDYILEHKCENNTWLCGTIIEPTNNVGYVVPRNYGTTPNNFQEEKILKDLKELQKGEDVIGSHVCPIVMHVDIWDAIGGYSEEFPTSTTDADIVAKMYKNGCRTFIGLRKSLGYHFSSKTRGRVPEKLSKERRFEMFKNKFGYTPPEFFKNIIRQQEVR